MLRKRNRTLLSLMLSFSLVLSLSTFALAGEFSEVRGVMEEHTTIISGTNSSNSPYVTMEQLKMLSDNAASLSENLTTYTNLVLKGDSHTFIIYHSRAVGFDGRKLSNKGSKACENDKATEVYVYVFYKDGFDTVSEDLLHKLACVQNDAYNIYHCVAKELPYEGYNTASIKSVSFKSYKGATVDVTGKGFIPANKCNYIKEIKLDNKNLSKELKKAMKPYVNKIKKDKQSSISANGCKVGGTFGNESDMYPLLVSTYPAYAGTDSTGQNNYHDIMKYFDDTPGHSDATVSGENPFEVCDRFREEHPYWNSTCLLYGKWYKSLGYFNAGGERGITDKSVKKKDSSIKKITGNICDNGNNIRCKKLTLKPNKGSKILGLADGGQDAEFIPMDVNKAPEKIIKVETNGNLFGIMYFK